MKNKTNREQQLRRHDRAIPEKHENFLPQGTQMTKKNGNRKYQSEAFKLRIHAAAAHFVNVSQGVTDIANAVGVNKDTIFAWAKRPEWKEALEFWKWSGGDPKPKRIQTSVPYTLSEVYLIEKAFKDAGDIRFVTYSGFIDTSVDFVDTYHIMLPGGEILKKINILLAFPKIKMRDVKRGIIRRNSIASLNLPPIESRRDRRKVTVDTKPGDIVRCILRNGLVVTGETVWLSKYNLILRVGRPGNKGGKIVILYRHGLYEFDVLKHRPKRPVKNDDDWDDEVE